MRRDETVLLGAILVALGIFVAIAACTIVIGNHNHVEAPDVEARAKVQAQRKEGNDKPTPEIPNNKTPK